MGGSGEGEDSSLTYLALGLISVRVTGWFGHMSFIIQQASLPGLVHMMAQKIPALELSLKVMYFSSLSRYPIY